MCSSGRQPQFTQAQQMEQAQSMGHQYPQTTVQHQQHKLATIANDMQAIAEQSNTQSLQANKRYTDDNSNQCIRQGLGSDTSPGWQRDRSKRSKMDSQPIHQTHLSQRDHGNLTSNPSHVENAHTRVPTQDPNRCSSNSLGMEERLQEQSDERHHPEHLQQAQPERHLCELRTYSRMHQSQGRLSQQKSRSQGLPIKSTPLPTNVQEIQLPSSPRPLRQQM